MKKLLIITLTAFYILLINITSYAEGITRIVIKNNYNLETTKVYLKDILDADYTDSMFIEKFGNIVVSGIKDESDKLDKSKLLTVLYKAGVDVDNLSIVMSSSVTLNRGQVIPKNDTLESKIKNILFTKYNIPKSDVKVEKTRILPKLVIDEDNQDLLKFKKVYAVDLSNLKNAKFGVVIQNFNGDKKQYYLFVHLNINTNVLTSAEDLSVGTQVTSKEVFTARKKLSSLEGKILNIKIASDDIYKAVKNINRDEIIYSDEIKKSEIVKEGTLVTLSYNSSVIRITTQGKLSQNGEVGELVAVVNNDSNRVITGRLMSKNLVEVSNEK